MVLITDEYGQQTDYGDSSQQDKTNQVHNSQSTFSDYAGKALGANPFAKVGQEVSDELKSWSSNPIWNDVVQYGPVLGPLKHWIFD